MADKPSNTQIEVSVSVLSQLFSYLDSLDVDREKFLESIDVDKAFVTSPDAYLPIELYLHIQDEAASYVNDPYLGLHMGEYAEAGSWSILGYLMMNCNTVEEAMRKSIRYSRIIGNLIEGTPKLVGLTKVCTVMDTPPHAPSMSRHCFESAMSSTLRMLRAMTGEPIAPVEVGFKYPKPEDDSEYLRVFKCPVLFDQKDNFMTFNISIAKVPILYANEEMLAHFETYAENLLAELNHNNETTQQVIKIILSKMDTEDLSIRQVAKELAMSTRTLQNHLKNEGVVFSDLMTEIREKLAKKYLKENYSVAQITYLLGYSEPSVFRKAFKKWAGITPKQFRDNAIAS